MSIYGWRVWYHWDERSHPFLYNGTNKAPLILRGVRGIEWPVELPLTAICGWRHLWSSGKEDTCQRSRSDCPGIYCQCGIYAVKQHQKLNSFTHNNVVGIIQLWGKIIEAEFGYRAQYGQIRAVINAPEIVATTYRIPNLPSIEYAQREYFPVQESKEAV